MDGGGLRCTLVAPITLPRSLAATSSCNLWSLVELLLVELLRWVGIARLGCWRTLVLVGLRARALAWASNRALSVALMVESGDGGGGGGCFRWSRDEVEEALAWIAPMPLRVVLRVDLEEISSFFSSSSSGRWRVGGSLRW